MVGCKRLSLVVIIALLVLLATVISIALINYVQPPAKVTSTRETGLEVLDDWRCFRDQNRHIALGKIENQWPEPIDHVLVTVDFYWPDGTYWATGQERLGRFNGLQTRVFYITLEVPPDVVVESCEIKMFDRRGNLLVEGVRDMALVYDIDFEAGDYSEWETDNNGDDMAVVMPGLNGSTYASETSWDPALAIEYVQNNLALQSLSLAFWHAGARLKTNGLNFGTGNAATYTFLQIDGSGGWQLRLIDGGGGTYDVEAQCPVAPGTGDGGGNDVILTAVVGIADDTEFTVEIRTVRSSADATSDGSYRLYVNGALEASNDAVDNHTEVSNASAGNFRHPASNIFGIADPGGSIFVDEIKFRDDDTFIFGTPSVISHLWLSQNGGSSYMNIGDSATWGTDLVGGIVEKPLTSLQTLWAMVGTKLYKTTNKGTSWTQIADVGYETDFIALLDGDVLFVANRASGGNRASIIDDLTGTVTHLNTGKTTTGGARDGDGLA